MIKKKKSSQKLPATKEDLKRLEEQIKIIKVETRTFNTQLKVVKIRIGMEMDDFKHELKDEMSLLRNDMGGMKDEIVGEIKAMREEYTAHQGAHSRQQETLDDHEERITSLEQPFRTTSG